MKLKHLFVCVFLSVLLIAGTSVALASGRSQGERDPRPAPGAGCEVLTSCDRVKLVVGNQHGSCEGWTLKVWLDGVYVGSATTDASCIAIVMVGAQDGQTITWEVWDDMGMLRRWGSYVCEAHVGCEVDTSCEEVKLHVGSQHGSCEGWTLKVWRDGVYVGEATTDSSCTTTIAAGAQNGQTVNWEVWDSEGMLRRWGSYVCQADG